MSSSRTGGLKLMSSPEAAEEAPEKECWLCAGTGKVRDYPMGITPHGVPDYFTIDPEVLKGINYDWTNYCGT
jgi:hypothetical protein